MIIMCMKKYAGICGIGFLFTSCQSFTSIINAETYKPSVFTNTVISDSLHKSNVYDIVLNAKKANMYKLKPLFYADTINAKNDSIAGFSIDSKLVTVKKQLSTLLFMLSDSCFYSKEYLSVKQPFSPYIAIEFVKGKNKIFYLFSFGTEEVRIASNDEVIGTFQINDMRLLLRWFGLVVPNDEYISNLKNKIK